MLQIALITELVKKEYPHSPSLLAMVDMALYDLLSQKQRTALVPITGRLPTLHALPVLPLVSTQ
ncbi:MAG: hypothetical protein R2788_19120 [Saprospiraceae bacterium]